MTYRSLMDVRRMLIRLVLPFHLKQLIIGHVKCDLLARSTCVKKSPRCTLCVGIVCFNNLNAFKRSIVRVDFKSFYNVTSLVHFTLLLLFF